MSIAALRPPAAVYREEQNFGWWVYALLAFMFVLGGLSLVWPRPVHGAGLGRGWALELPIGMTVGLVLPPVLAVGVLRMTTEVVPGEVTIWFGWIPTYRRSFSLTSVERLEVVQFRPLRDHGFWGPRVSRDGEHSFTARGDRGVRIHFHDGTRLLIGSQRPESLATAIEQAMQPEAGAQFP